MEETKNLAEMSLNYKIDGEVCSFKTKQDFIEFIQSYVKGNEALTVEPIGLDDHLGYDHMQEIKERAWEVEACVKGIAAMAELIQETEFQDFNHCNMTCLAVRSCALLDEIMDIGQASAEVYESDRKARNLRAELSKHKTA